MPPEALAYRARRLAHRFGVGAQYVPSDERSPGGMRGAPLDLDFVLIGAQKAGSTFLHHAIQHHPNLFMPIGEIPVFEDPDYSSNGLAWLEELMEAAPLGARRGIKRPDYLGRPESPEYLARHVPDARLIVVLREPVARTLSAYYHYMRRGHLPTMPAEEGIQRLLDGSLDEAWPRAWEVIGYSLYGECLERYMDHFSASQIFILTQDEVIGAPDEALAQLYDFLGVDSAFAPPGLEGKTHPTVYSLPRVRFLAWAEGLRTEVTQEVGRNFHRPGLLGKLAYAGAMSLDRGLLRRMYGNPRPEISPELRQRLSARFAPDLQRVQRFLGDRVASWLGGQ